MIFPKLAIQILSATCVIASLDRRGDNRKPKALTPVNGEKLRRLDVGDDGPKGEIHVLPQSIPGPPYGDLYKHYKPTLNISAGCTPYPAVNPWGDTSASVNFKYSSCQSKFGQIYGRIFNETESPHRFAIMYAWYFPVTGNKFIESHDWQQVVVWLSKDHKSIIKVSYSHRDGYKKLDKSSLSDSNRLLVQVKDEVLPDKEGHALDFAITGGAEQDLIAWENFTPPAKTAVSNDKNFGGKVAPFADSQYKAHLDAAF